MSSSNRILTATLASLLLSGAALADDNLARGVQVRQSSLGFGGLPQRAVDGNTDGNYNRGSVTHTQNGAPAWLELDLGQERTVGTVAVHNRTDCCAERLNGARVELGAEPCDRYVRRWSMTLPPSGAGVATKTVLDFGAVAARYVCVRLDTRDYLSVAEVEVFAPQSTRAERPTGATPSALVGEYAARHPHWSGTVTLRADGSYARDNGDPGTWSFDGRVLTLAWKNWGPERLADRGGGRFQAESNGFELVRRGAQPAPREPQAQPLMPPAAPDCGTGADDTGCNQARDGLRPMAAADFKTLLATLRGERNEIARKEVLETLLGDHHLTARQLVTILGEFNNELHKLDVARDHVGRVVDPKAAVPFASLFRNSISRREFIELMTQ